ncbi:hypothetical protein HOD38_00295 [archaeon]|jgi:hypothetical protein|nr:hypothetical protein [archaeon]MBT4396686.1 hypothetical protein [archaeon]MBT4441296.1 hypothetical protein [archaeon]
MQDLQRDQLARLASLRREQRERVQEHLMTQVTPGADPVEERLLAVEEVDDTFDYSQYLPQQLSDAIDYVQANKEGAKGELLFGLRNINLGHVTLGMLVVALGLSLTSLAINNFRPKPVLKYPPTHLETVVVEDGEFWTDTRVHQTTGEINALYGEAIHEMRFGHITTASTRVETARTLVSQPNEELEELLKVREAEVMQVAYAEMLGEVNSSFSLELYSDLTRDLARESDLHEERSEHARSVAEALYAESFSGYLPSPSFLNHLDEEIAFFREFCRDHNLEEFRVKKEKEFVGRIYDGAIEDAGFSNYEEITDALRYVEPWVDELSMDVSVQQGEILQNIFERAEVYSGTDYFADHFSKSVDMGTELATRWGKTDWVRKFGTL